MSTDSSPTVRGRRLALELRKRRERAGLSPQAAASLLGWSPSKVSRVENGRTRPSVSDVANALGAYGADTAEREVLLALARDAQKRGWYHEYGDVFAGPYIGLEDGASQIREWEPQLVPGLLQTAAYAREVIAAGLGGDSGSGDVQRRVRARMARRELLGRPTPPHLHVVLNEGALRRQIGGAAVMGDQLGDLLAASRRPNVTVQVVPFVAGSHAGLEGPFVVLSFPKDPDIADPDIVYVESFAGDVYLESAEQVARCNLAFERICESALDPEESAVFIADIAKESQSHAQSHTRR